MDMLGPYRITGLGAYRSGGRWASAIRGNPRFFLVHGEQKALEALQAGLKHAHGIDSTIAKYRQTITL